MRNFYHLALLRWVLALVWAGRPLDGRRGSVGLALDGSGVRALDGSGVRALDGSGVRALDGSGSLALDGSGGRRVDLHGDTEEKGKKSNFEFCQWS